MWLSYADHDHDIRVIIEISHSRISLLCVHSLSVGLSKDCIAGCGLRLWRRRVVASPAATMLTMSGYIVYPVRVHVLFNWNTGETRGDNHETKAKANPSRAEAHAKPKRDDLNSNWHDLSKRNSSSTCAVTSCIHKSIPNPVCTRVPFGNLYYTFLIARIDKMTVFLC